MVKLKRYWRIVLILLAVVIFFVLVWAGYKYGGDQIGFAQYTGTIEKDDRFKTFWDWLQLLIIPVGLALGALLFNWQERKNEIKIAEDRRRIDIEIADSRNQEALLQNYLDKMSELILEKQLLDVKEILNQFSENGSVKHGDIDVLTSTQQAVLNMAQVRTVTVLRQLNSTRGNIVTQFLKDSNLSSFLLIGVSLNNATLDDINFNGFNLSNVNLRKSTLCRSYLADTNLNRADLEEANMREAKLGRSNLSGAHLTGANLSGSILNCADLSEADLSRATMTGTILISANLTKANLRGDDLRNCHLHNPKLIGADLTGAELSRINLTGVNLSGARLCEANLSLADLSSADLSNANLNGACLRGANLTGADLTGADLFGADLSNAKVTEAQLSNTNM